MDILRRLLHNIQNQRTLNYVVLSKRLDNCEFSHVVPVCLTLRDCLNVYMRYMIELTQRDCPSSGHTFMHGQTKVTFEDVTRFSAEYFRSSYKQYPHAKN